MPAIFKSACALLFLLPAALAQAHGSLRASGSVQRLMTKDLPVPRDWLTVQNANERDAEEFSSSFNYHPPTDTGDDAELPPIDDSGRWQIRLSLFAKKGLLNENAAAAADKLKALFAALGYTGSVKIKIGKTVRRRLPWDTSRLLQAADSCPDGVYVPLSITGDIDLAADTAKSVVQSGDFATIFSDASLVCGIKLYDFRSVTSTPTGPYVPTIDCGAVQSITLKSGESSKVYSLTPQDAGTVTFSTCDPATNLNTVLKVFSSNPVADPSATVLASNDDDVTCADSTEDSTVAVKVEHGTTVYVEASTASTAGGSISLSATCSVY